MQLRRASVSVIDAVDMLSDMAEWNSSLLKKELVSNQQLLKDVFLAVLQYMQTLATKEQLKDAAIREGLQALMSLATEAVHRIEKVQGQGSVTGLQEVKNLESFYTQKISPHLPKEGKELETEESTGGWAIQEIEKVRLDDSYELFLIRKEEGSGYFTNSLLHHIQLVAKFDALILHLSDDQPLKKIEILSDRDCHDSAKGVLSGAAPLIDLYYKEALKFKQLGFVSLINKSLMALMLAANPRNLISNTVSKNASKYYQDFHNYLREAFTSVEYMKLKEIGSERSEHFLHTVMQLSLELCSHFVTKKGSKREEILFIRSLIKDVGKNSPLTFWHYLSEIDGHLRLYFKQYPSFPLLKISKLIQGENLMEGFDPLSQGAYPNQLYRLHSESMDLSVLRLPSPIRQEIITLAEMVPEFRAWIGLLKVQGHHHLLINLQDRTSWKEHARSVCLEKNQSHDALTVVTFAKSTEFYHQSGPYAEWDDAAEFKKLCKEQIFNEQTGFYFPSEVKEAGLIDFIEPALTTIHSIFFGKKERLTQQNRLDFIDIFYLFLTLKLVEILHVDSVSFTDKDGVDSSAAMDAQFLAFMRMMAGQNSWEKEESDQLLSVLYSPALLQRGRVIESGRFQRMRSSLQVVVGALDTDASSVSKSASELYSVSFFKNLKVS